MKIQPVLAVILVFCWIDDPYFAKAAHKDSTQAKPQTDPKYDWFIVPIEVKNFPSDAELAPVACTIHFSDLLSRLKVSGAVDERSLRLYRLAGGREIEVPIQFAASPQPRPPARRLSANTPASVSYVGEYKAGETPEVPKVVGELHWIARAHDRPATEAYARDSVRRHPPANLRPGNSSSPNHRRLRHASAFQYLLKFGVPRSGHLIQVPFPPQNLRAFDEFSRATPVRWFPQMQIRPQWPFEGTVQLLDGSQRLAAYHIGPTLKQANEGTSIRRPFLYPVNGPDGISLTEFGKPHDPTGSHAHHYSLWIAHADIDGRDFWSEKGGIIAHDQFAIMEDGPLFSRLVQKTRWVINREEILLEQRRLTFYSPSDDFRLIDVDLEFHPAAAKAVTLGKTSFGFLAARVAQSMTVFDGGGEILNANGDRNEQGAHLKRAVWIDQSGPIAPAKWGGLAILDHPENINHPTGWHCRNDGWAGAAFNMERPHTIEPGTKLSLRYRIHLHRGNAVEGQVARRFAEYSAKPVVQLGEPSR